MQGVSAGGDPKLCLVPICDHPYRRESPLLGPTDLGEQASKEIAAGLNGILADVFTLNLKTKNFHWHFASACSLKPSTYSLLLHGHCPRSLSSMMII
jgi:hypothetical protein